MPADPTAPGAAQSAEALAQQIAQRLGGDADASTHAVVDALHWIGMVLGADEPEALDRLPAAAAELEAALGRIGPVLPPDERAAARELLQALAPALRALALRAEPDRGGGARARAEPPAAPPPAAEAGPTMPAALPAKAVFGASGPATVAPGAWFVARFLVCREGDEQRLRDLLNALEGAAGRVRHVGLSSATLSGPALLRLRPGPGLAAAEGSPLQRELVWNGELLAIDFDLVADTQPAQPSTLLRFEVEMAGVTVARLSLELQFAATTAGTQVGRARLPRRAFASYSSQNRERVLDRIAALRIDSGMDVFVDCLDLAPGEAWKPRLRQEIESRDLFVLFWSSAAAQSRWVRWEYEQALAVHAADALQIQPLENGVRAPRRLSHLHFGDPLNDVREAHSARRRAA